MQPGTLAVSQWLDFGSKNAQAVNGNASLCIGKRTKSGDAVPERKNRRPQPRLFFSIR